MELIESVDLHADPTSVYELVTDFGRLDESDPNVISSRLVGGSNLLRPLFRLTSRSMAARAIDGLEKALS